MHRLRKRPPKQILQVKHPVIPSDPDITSGESRNPAPAIKMGIFILFLIVIDQLTKLAAKSFLQPQTNYGSFLGLYIGKFPLFSLAIASLAFVILLGDLIRQRQIGIGEILILSGGLSNIIDRLIRPGVIDWIPFFGLWFNLADTFIAIGVAFIIWNTVFKSFPQRRTTLNAQ